MLFICLYINTISQLYWLFKNRYFAPNLTKNLGWKKIDNYWQSIRICIRNGYKIEDATLWCDYIDNLRFFGKDLYNAKYVCPTNLHAEHDRYMRKKAKADARQELEKQLEKEAEYKEAKAKFFGIVFSDGKISVRVLESVAEIIQEGKLMHHYAKSLFMCSANSNHQIIKSLPLNHCT